MMYYEVINIDYLPKTVNSLLRKHWRYQKKEKDLCHRLVLQQIIKIIPKEPLSTVNITLTRHSSREPDYDGLVSSFKYIIDALTRYKVIIDDKPSIIGYPTYIWQPYKKGKGYVTVEIEENKESNQNRHT